MLACEARRCSYAARSALARREPFYRQKGDPDCPLFRDEQRAYLVAHLQHQHVLHPCPLVRVPPLGGLKLLWSVASLATVLLHSHHHTGIGIGSDCKA